jgi:hypothetical protein
MLKSLLVAALAAVGVCYSAPNATNASSTFTNPILNTVGADPYVTFSRCAFVDANCA